MISQSPFKKTIIISMLGHLAIFCIFGISFGRIVYKVNYGNLSFWGQVLNNLQVSKPSPAVKGLSYRVISHSPRYYLSPISRPQEPYPWSAGFVKPHSILASNSKKAFFIEKSKIQLFQVRKIKPAIIFHPLLPYSFTIYFKDRQIAHVELMFKTTDVQQLNPIIIKRKISSGNLEVDLLCKRYIERYLFMHRYTQAINSNWQTVKIDLQAGYD
jgi:hypothetical protein